ncbi:hypothetical protein CANARDRAFT_20479 [[Candida] arabinofermentans NRRL YB-2248]|uniref:Kinetochore protein SPC25 n=1 Tax=[Candida] arabinofermentans NRRL YB-2248 TaxID=983967 RepID=A0A1E4T7L0_9ASCO|nr:hypothetical protein CANARDRAFT_20479 [[Candida] arabinofermentans NRRL YB-2248]
MSSQQALEESLEKFEDLKPQLETLKSKLDQYLSTVEQNLINKKSKFEKELLDIYHQEKDLNNQLIQQKQIQEQLSVELNKDSENFNSSSLKLKELNLKQDEFLKEKSKIEFEIDKINKKIQSDMNSINSEKNFINNQSQLINEKTYQFENLLGLSISSVDLNGGEDDDEYYNGISFTFKNIDPDDFNKTVSFIFDPTNYKIISSNPKLDDDIINRIIDNFKNHKEIGYLWKDMRYELKNKLLS